jgi:hypothetical protein
LKTYAWKAYAEIGQIAPYSKVSGCGTSKPGQCFTFENAPESSGVIFVQIDGSEMGRWSDLMVAINDPSVWLMGPVPAW